MRACVRVCERAHARFAGVTAARNCFGVRARAPPARAAESLKKCTGCKLTFYCNATCQRAHWSTRHKWVCALVRMLSDQGASETPVDEFTVSAFNRINIGTRVVDDGVAGRGLETTSAVVKGTILALFVHTKAPVNSMEQYKYCLLGSLCIADRPNVLPNGLNGSFANDAASEEQLRTLCDPPADLTPDGVGRRVGKFAREYAVDATRTATGAQAVGTARIVEAAEAGLSFDGAVLIAARDLPAGTRVLWHYTVAYWLHMAAADCMPWPVHPLTRWYINMVLLRGCRRLSLAIAHGCTHTLLNGNTEAMQKVSWTAMAHATMKSQNLTPSLPAWLRFETHATGMHSCMYGSPEYQGPDQPGVDLDTPFFATYSGVTRAEVDADIGAERASRSALCAPLLVKSVWPHGYTVTPGTVDVVHAYNRRVDDAVYPLDVLAHLYTQMVAFMLSSTAHNIPDGEEACTMMHAIVGLLINDKAHERAAPGS